VSTGRELERFDGHAGAATSVAFAPDGRSLASGGEDGMIRVWQVP
jgi:WD40 repeat protein